MLKVGIISLGCAKNLIDSEIMIGHLGRAGMAITSDPADADALIINTCSFIDMAKRESIESIYEMTDARAADDLRQRQKIIVSGCLSQRFAQELPDLMPEVDAFIGLDQLAEVPRIIQELVDGEGQDRENGRNFVTRQPAFIPDYDTPRFRLTPSHFAYIKIAEGCNHPCSFCIIPKIRGRHRSRTVESVVTEAKQLIGEGVREINLISQDTTYFGMDRWDSHRPKPTSPVDSSRGEALTTLLRELNAIEGDFWIRILYTHPAHWSDELIQTIADCPKVARYVDIPLQHISDRMLESMRRETSGAYIRDLIQRMRTGIPDLAIRTTFIVGFPGETEDDFGELLEFMDEARFERAGVFSYSREEGTRAYKLDRQTHHMTRKSRQRRAMERLEQLARERGSAMVGRRIRVLIDQPGIARSQWDAPEIDGTVLVDERIPPGTFAEVQISDWRGHDLIAK